MPQAVLQRCPLYMQEAEALEAIQILSAAELSAKQCLANKNTAGYEQAKAQILHWQGVADQANELAAKARAEGKVIIWYHIDSLVLVIETEWLAASQEYSAAEHLEVNCQCKFPYWKVVDIS